MRSNALPDFKPSVHGFRFANRWPAGPAFELRAGYVRVGVGEVADGLCGGMCFAAADRYLAGRDVTSETTAPPAGSSLFREIARRQLDSLDRLVFVPSRFWWTGLLVASGRWTTGRQAAQWRRLLADIDAGRPAMAGLVRAARVSPLGLSVNHQVLGFGYEASAASGTLRIYDPNHPGEDGVEIRIRRVGADPANPANPANPADPANPANPAHPAAEPGKAPAFILEQSTGEPLLALLRLPYREPRQLTR